MSLIINDNIEITILEIGKDRIKVGINAKEISIKKRDICDGKGKSTGI